MNIKSVISVYTVFTNTVFPNKRFFSFAEFRTPGGGGIHTADHEHDQPPASAAPAPESGLQQGGLCRLHGGADQDALLPGLYHQVGTGNPVFRIRKYFEILMTDPDLGRRSIDPIPTWTFFCSQGNKLSNRYGTGFIFYFKIFTFLNFHVSLSCSVLNPEPVLLKYWIFIHTIPTL
jgi:hypothetical protein